MLTPAADDPNRKEELQRREANPYAFGNQSHTKRPPDWNPQGVLSQERVVKKDGDQQQQQQQQQKQNQQQKPGTKTGK